MHSMGLKLKARYTFQKCEVNEQMRWMSPDFQDPCSIHDKKLQLAQCLPTKVMPVHLQTPGTSFLCIVHEIVLKRGNSDT